MFYLSTNYGRIWDAKSASSGRDVLISHCSHSCAVLDCTTQSSNYNFHPTHYSASLVGCMSTSFESTGRRRLVHALDDRRFPHDGLVSTVCSVLLPPQLFLCTIQIRLVLNLFPLFAPQQCQVVRGRCLLDGLILSGFQKSWEP